MIKFLQILIGTLLITSISGYSAPITMASIASTSSITDYFIDFAECSCNIMPLICDNYCCCDSLCGSSVSTWSANYQCLTTSSTIQVPCGQTTKGFGAIEDLTCVYYSNRGRIGYYYSPTASTTQTATSAYSFSTKIVTAKQKQKQLLTALSLSNGYTFANQYLKISTSQYLYLPFAGIGGNCVPGLVNFTASGTYSCKLIVTSSNCASINEAYTGSIKICTKGDCSAFSSVVSVPSTTSGSTCDNIINDFTLSATLGYSGGSYSLTNVNYIPNPVSSINFGSEIQVKVTISIATATQKKSGNPGYIIGKPITMPNGIGQILSTTNGICAVSASGTLTIPFATNVIYSCPSSLSCSTNYYIDNLSNISLTVNKYASSSQTISVVKSTTLGCKAETLTLKMLYSHNGWDLDPQYYIVGAILTDKSTSDQSNPKNKYLKVEWIYVDPTTVTTPPSNNFYTYFSYLWTPLKQKFGMS